MLYGMMMVTEDNRSQLHQSCITIFF